jgi:hypothetical protein
MIGADVDDRPATGLCHLLGNELGAKEHAGLVDGEPMPWAAPVMIATLFFKRMADPRSFGS